MSNLTVEELIEMGELGNIYFSGWDVVSLGILSTTFDALIASGNINPTPEITGAINDLLEKVDQLVFDATGIHVYDEAPDPA